MATANAVGLPASYDIFALFTRVRRCISRSGHTAAAAAPTPPQLDRHPQHRTGRAFHDTGRHRRVVLLCQQHR